MIHELKILPEYFEDVISGKKTFEIRKNDRPFHVGDLLALNEFDADRKCYTGNSCLVYIDYILFNDEYCKSGFVVMAIKPCGITRFGSPYNARDNRHDYSVPLATTIDELRAENIRKYRGITMKYTDEQIKKALELCSSENFDVEVSCASCPLYTPDRIGFEDDMCLHRDKLALDLINRLQAQNERDVKVKVEALYKVNDLKLEIERLQGKVEMYEEERKYHFAMSRKKIAEAIKEFAESLKAKIHDSVYQYWNFGDGGYYLAEDVDDDIDNLVKEMVGESDG